MGRLFGTDGIRGVANKYPMTSEMAVKIGRSVANLLSSSEQTGRKGVVIGKDTRISGDMLAYAVASGICSMGENVRYVGVLPTPGVAYLARSLGAVGIMISASHNPYEDNGIKIFDKNGFKLSDPMEKAIEVMVEDPSIHTICESVKMPGCVVSVPDAERQYINFLKNCIDNTKNFKGLKIVLDCANGATYKIAPILFKELGADIEAMFVEPDGKNINENCGSQHIEALSKRVIETGANIGLAFDGDADRLVAVDEHGRAVSGDKILAICASFLKKRGLLKNNLAISTVMSNIGLVLALKQMDIRHMMTDVGDRFVLEEMIAQGAVLGGEDSGHMIFLDHHTTGDGMLTAIKLLEALITENRSLSEAAQMITVFPQILMNVEVTEKPDISSIPEIDREIKKVEKILGDKGRVLVRYSGTQSLCRVMVEGPTEDITRSCCETIVDAVKKTIGNQKNSCVKGNL